MKETCVYFCFDCFFLIFCFSVRMLHKCAPSILYNVSLEHKFMNDHDTTTRRTKKPKKKKEKKLMEKQRIESVCPLCIQIRRYFFSSSSICECVNIVFFFIIFYRITYIWCVRLHSVAM